LPPIRSSDPVRCAEAIVDRAGRDIALAMPIGVGKPVALVNALYRLAEADRRIRLRIFTGLSLVRPPYRTSLERRFVAPLLDRTCGSYPELDYTKALRGGGLPPNIEVTEFFLQAGAWLSNASVQRSYTSLNYSQVAGHLERTGTNVFGQLVAPHPQGEPRISLSSNTDVTLDMVPYILRRRQAGQPLALAVEINANLPYMPGAAEMDVNECDVVLETDRPHYALFAPPKEPVSLPD
jgi:acyl-CoA hydrolase